MWNEGLKSAIEVATLVESKLPKKMHAMKMFNLKEEDLQFIAEEWYYIQGYQNGREHGITLWFPNIKGHAAQTIYITRHRSSDELGFYVGDPCFSGLSKNAYENEFISCVSVEDCANLIIRIIAKWFSIGKPIFV